MTAARLVVCSTCRFSEAEATDAAGLSGGQRLLEAVTTIMAGEAGAETASELRVEAQACLWACSSRCTVYLAQDGKPAYLAGRFSPTPEAAEAIVAFFRLFAGSADGAVSYREWPEGMKGHFIARLPADG